MDIRYLLPLILLCGLCYADTGFNPPSVIVSTDDAHAVSKGIQKLILSTGTALSISGSTAKITTDKTTVSSMTVASQLNVSQIKWTSQNSMMLYKDAVVIMSLPTTQDTFFGYNTNLINSGGVFNTSYGGAAMPYPYTGNFNNCVGNSCMSGNLLQGENNNGMGYAAAGSLSTGFYNNAMGGSALNLTTTGSGNTAVGAYSLFHNVDQNYSTAVGYRAGFWSTGTLNIYIGYESGTSTDTANATGGDTSMIFIGQETGKARLRGDTLDNAGAIGKRAYVNKSNAFQIGGVPGSGFEWEVMTTSFTAQSGWIQLGPHTKAELGALTPTAVGQQYYCSDCTTDAVAVSTGTTRGGFGRATSKSTFPS